MNNNKLIDKMFVAYVNAKKVICVSEFLKNELLNYSIDNTIVIPNVFKKRSFDQSNEKSLISENTKYKFLMVCMPSQNKGIDTIIKVVKKLLVHNCNFIFNIIGDSKDLPYYKKLVREMDLESYIIFLGPMNKKDIVKYYVSSSFYVCASNYETFGVSLLESISFGLPVITTDCGGPRDIITNDNGILISNNTEKMILSTLLDVLSGNYNFNKNSIINDYEQRFSSKNTCSKILGLYN